MNQARGRNRKGHIYRRWKKKKYSATDTSVSGKGVLYLRYMVGGKIIEESLRTGDLEEAKRKADSIMKPLEVASRKDALLQTKFRLEKLDEELVQYRNKLLLSDSWNAYLENLDRPNPAKPEPNFFPRENLRPPR